tara:strand:- start:5831 stop:6088 length:258 start_codon:yes stop_codon:yes gene_type:complete
MVEADRNNDFHLFFSYRNLFGSISVDPKHPKLSNGRSAEQDALRALAIVVSTLESGGEGVDTVSKSLIAQYWSRKLKPTIEEYWP